MAAHNFSQEQLRLVEQTRIVDTGGVNDIRQKLAAVPHEQFTAILEHFVCNPALLQDESLANLASLTSRQEMRLGERDE